MKFQKPITTKMLKKYRSLSLVLQLSDIVFILLINVKMPTIYEQEKGLVIFIVCCSPSIKINTFRLETLKQVLMQTAKTQMKCCKMQHFIRVCTLCHSIFQERNTIFFCKLQPVTPQYIQLDHPDSIACSYMESPIVLKRVDQ